MGKRPKLRRELEKLTNQELTTILEAVLEADGWRVLRGADWPKALQSKDIYDFCVIKGMQIPLSQKARNAMRAVVLDDAVPPPHK